MSKGKPIYYFPEMVEILAGIKGRSKVFVECGTCGGETVKAASLAGFEKIYSMEINPEFFNNTLKLFEDAGEPLNTQMFLYLGSSVEILPTILELIPKDEPSVFFLDAHDHTHGVAAYDELALIKNHVVKTHTLLIDDIPLYFGNGSQLQKIILDINPNYKFESLDCPVRMANPLPNLSGVGMRLLAYI